MFSKWNSKAPSQLQCPHRCCLKMVKYSQLRELRHHIEREHELPCRNLTCDKFLALENTEFYTKTDNARWNAKWFNNLPNSDPVLVQQGQYYWIFIYFY